MYTNNFHLDIICVEMQNQTRMGGWLAGSAENKTNSAPTKVGVWAGAEFGNITKPNES